MSKFILTLSWLILFYSCKNDQKKEIREFENKKINRTERIDKKYSDKNGFINMAEITAREFLTELKVEKNNGNDLNILSTIGQTRKDWLTITDVEYLISQIESKAKAKCINRVISSFIPNSENMTIGNQAISILDAYRLKEPYPNRLYICEIYGLKKRNEIREWWALKKQ